MGIVLPGGGDIKALYVIIEVFSATDGGDPLPKPSIRNAFAAPLSMKILCSLSLPGGCSLNSLDPSLNFLPPQVVGTLNLV